MQRSDRARHRKGPLKLSRDKAWRSALLRQWHHRWSWSAPARAEHNADRWHALVLPLLRTLIFFFLAIWDFLAHPKITFYATDATQNAIWDRFQASGQYLKDL